VVLHGTDEMLVRCPREAIIAASADPAPGLDERLGRELAKDFSRSFHWPLAQLRGQPNRNLSVSREEVKHQQMIHIQSRMLLNELQKLTTSVLPFYCDPNRLSGSPVDRRFLSLGQQIAEDPGNTEVRRVGQPHLGKSLK
jgi:hypothetical protein